MVGLHSNNTIISQPMLVSCLLIMGLIYSKSNLFKKSITSANSLHFTLDVLGKMKLSFLTYNHGMVS